MEIEDNNGGNATVIFRTKERRLTAIKIQTHHMDSICTV